MADFRTEYEKLYEIISIMKKIVFILLVGFAIVTTFAESNIAESNMPGFDIEAHRGGRDIYPENTLPAFANAIKLGVTTLELDTAVTKDRVVVVSHNPKLNYAITRDNTGRFIPKSSNIFIKDLTFSALKKYDVGRLNPDTNYYYSHREQKAVPGTHIPSLAEVFDLTRKMHADKIRFNIEIKTYPPFPEYTIPREEFVKLVLRVIRDYEMENRTVIQSFDWNSLKIVKTLAPNIKIGCLTGKSYNLQPGMPGASPWLAGLDYDDYNGSISELVKVFGGDIVSPYYRDISIKDINEAHRLDLKIIVWTVNRTDTMINLIAWGVDGIITDRPDRLLELIGKK